MPDMTETVAPKSDQLDNLELREGPQVFTVTSVDLRLGTDQPVHVHLAEFPRPWKPGKNQRRVLKHCWGKETDDWHGQKVELFSDTSVKFGNETPGGTRISRLTGIAKTTHVPILQGQGKPGTFKVEPLPGAAPPPALSEPSEADVAACTDQDTLRDWYRVSSPDRQAQILARKTDLDNEPGAGVEG